MGRDRKRFRRRNRELQYQMGWMCASIFVLVCGVPFLVFHGFAGPKLAGFIVLCAVVAHINPVPLGGVSVKSIKRVLGITAVEGMLMALATHLKLRFKLVPEHYECEPNN